MPPPLSRFPSGGPTALSSPYHQQFPSHQNHGGGHQPNPSYLNANAQINSPFSANGNVLSGLNGAFGVGVGMGADTGLGSHAARMGFAHAVQAQHGQAQQHGMLGEHPGMRNQATKGRIREVWKHNLHEEMAVLRDLVDKYPYIAMVSQLGSAPTSVCAPSLTSACVL